jgi:hypothetical protein
MIVLMVFIGWLLLMQLHFFLGWAVDKIEGSNHVSYGSGDETSIFLLATAVPVFIPLLLLADLWDVATAKPQPYEPCAARCHACIREGVRAS